MNVPSTFTEKVTHGHPGAAPAPVWSNATRSSAPTAPPAKMAPTSRLSRPTGQDAIAGDRLTTAGLGLSSRRHGRTRGDVLAEHPAVGVLPVTGRQRLTF